MFGKPKNNSVDEDFVDSSDADDGKGDTQRGGSDSAGAGFLLDRSKPSVISEGFIKGTVSTDVVNIGPRGAIEGQVTSKSLHVKGAFVGTAVCDELFIASKARVVGRITYRIVAIQRGALIEGELVHAA